jgi:hypothetical protein
LTRQHVAAGLDLARGNIAVNHYPELPCIGAPPVPVQGILISAHKKAPALGVKRRGELIFILRGIRHNKYIQSG